MGCPSREARTRVEKVQFSLTLRRVVLLGTPLVLTILMLFHPSPYYNVAGELIPIAAWWIALHTILFLLVPLMGVPLWLLIAGMSTGILALSAQVGVLGERAAVASIENLWADPFKTLLFDIGRYAWIVALAMAAVALWRAGAPRLPLMLMALPAYLVTFDHAFPFGSLTFGSFFVIAAWIELASGRLTLAGQHRRVS